MTVIKKKYFNINNTNKIGLLFNFVRVILNKFSFIIE